MTNTKTKTANPLRKADPEPIARILEDSPAVIRKDWIPAESPFSELTALHTEHLATLDDLKGISSEIIALRARYEREDDQSLEFQRGQYAGTIAEDAKAPKRTPNGTREQKLQELTQRGAVTQDHLRDVCSEVCRTVYENLDEWSALLEEGEEQLQTNVRVLRAELAKAEEEAAQAPDLRTWLNRTAARRPAYLLHWGWFQNEKPTNDVLSIANEGRNRFNSRPSDALLAEQTRLGGGLIDDGSNPDGPEDVTVDYNSESYIEMLDDQLAAYVRSRRAGQAAPGGL